jgi:hypothetical protein
VTAAMIRDTVKETLNVEVRDLAAARPSSPVQNNRTDVSIISNIQTLDPSRDAVHLHVINRTNHSVW